MPRKFARKPRRKAYKKRNYRRGKTSLFNRAALQPFASRYITKMKYSESFILNLGNSYSAIMNLNSVFDPNSALGGHQPYGYDQLTPIYNRYRVIACSYVINCYNQATAIRFGCLPSNSTPPVTNMSELCENPRSQFRVQLPGGSTQTIKGKVNIPALLGRTKAQYMADDRYQAQNNASPGELALLYITAQAISDATIDTNMVVTLEYTVEWFDPNPIDQS